MVLQRLTPSCWRMGPFAGLFVAGGFLEDMARIGGVCFSGALSGLGDTHGTQLMFYPHGTAL
jgi:hypothetical protein